MQTMYPLSTISLFCDIFYLGSAALVIAIYVFYKPLLNYGKTSQPQQTRSTSILVRLETFLMSLTLPRSTFNHFYIFGLFWLVVIKTAAQCFYPAAFTFELNLVIWLYAFQLSRRLYECVRVMRSSGTMHLFHYLAGIAFYLVTPISLIVNNFIPHKSGYSIIWTLVLASVFVHSWYDQHLNHVYLASLRQGCAKTYAFPTKFTVICPHYWNEIVMYTALVLLSRSSPCVLIWLVVDLGISAKVQRKWYIVNFGLSVVNGRRHMIPLF